MSEKKFKEAKGDLALSQQILDQIRGTKPEQELNESPEQKESYV
jgi:hypothetical protein